MLVPITFPLNRITGQHKISTAFINSTLQVLTFPETNLLNFCNTAANLLNTSFTWEETDLMIETTQQEDSFVEFEKLLHSTPTSKMTFDLIMQASEKLQEEDWLCHTKIIKNLSKFFVTQGISFSYPHFSQRVCKLFGCTGISLLPRNNSNPFCQDLFDFLTNRIMQQSKK